MDILYLAHRIPYPPNKGDKLRSFHQLQYLAQRHRVWCACFIDDPGDWRHVPHLCELCADVAAFELQPRAARWRALRSLLSGGTATCGYFHDARLAAALTAWSKQVRFDSVVAFSSSMVPYALQVPAARRVLDLCDCDSQKWLDYARSSLPPKKWLYAVEGRRLASFENKCVWLFDETIVITRSEAACLAANAGSVRIIANGVAIPPLPPRHDFSATSGEVLVVGFVGALNYRPNVDAVCWFVKHCWPAIRHAHPTAVFRVIGHSPARAVRRLGRIPGVQVIGPVPDVSPEILRFDVSVAPLRIARGLQNKVLEAMAYGRPLVLTSAAAEGVCGQSGEHFIVADQAAQFAQAVTKLLSDAAARKRLGESARELVSRHHRWEPLLCDFERAAVGDKNVDPLGNVESTPCSRAYCLHNAPAQASEPLAHVPI